MSDSKKKKRRPMTSLDNYLGANDTTADDT